MFRAVCVLAFLLYVPGFAFSQVDQLPPGDQAPGPSQAPPRSDESSSRDTKIDLSPPKDDDKTHPTSGGTMLADPIPGTGAGDVQEMHYWDPHKALKDIEVGDFYFKQKNYKAALDRYREALMYKANDAIANFRMAECFAKLDQPDEAVSHYQEYLKILPHGPLARDAHKALDKLNRSQSELQKKQ